jgi:hypothetical protein
VGTTVFIKPFRLKRLPLRGHLEYLVVKSHFGEPTSCLGLQYSHFPQDGLMFGHAPREHGSVSAEFNKSCEVWAPFEYHESQTCDVAENVSWYFEEIPSTGSSRGKARTSYSYHISNSTPEVQALYVHLRSSGLRGREPTTRLVPLISLGSTRTPSLSLQKTRAPVTCNWELSIATS